MARTVFAPIPAIQQDRAVQRYKIVTAAQQNAHNYGLNHDLRLSDDGKMAVRDTANGTPNGTAAYQTLYLTAALLLSAQNALAATGSGITLAHTGNSIRGKPQGNLIKHTLLEIQLSFTDIATNESYSACNAVMWNVLGAVRNAAPTAIVSHGVFKADVNGATEISGQPTDNGPVKAVRTEITGQAASGAARTDWQALGNGQRDKAARKYGINQFAKPRAAEGIGIYHAGPGGNTAAAHFAGVIARSGGDYITVENYAGNPGSHNVGPNNVNPNWFVRMFGGKTGQSFYSFHKAYESADYGTQPMAVRFRGI